MMAIVAMVGSACGARSGDAGDAASGLGDSIGVAGHWSIDIVDPDGTIDRHVEFHNEFVGQNVLARILAGEFTSFSWNIAVGGVDPICPGGLLDRCYGPGTPTLDPSTDELVVTGETTATSSGEIATVVADVDYEPGSASMFSLKSLDVASGGPGVIPVAAGQIVQVEIRYSFSTV